MKLNEKYNKNSFIDFIDTFLPEDFQSKEEDIIIKKDRYKEITKAKILGFCESLDLHVLEMDHTHDKDPRVAIATDAFKILADHWIHRALVIFKNNDSENYRFSCLTITLDLNDKNKVTKKYSNARRYSFYLGANAKVKTPEQQLIKKGKVKDIDDLLSRFSVEVVNKQFYLEVAKFFDELVSIEDQNLILPGVSEKDINTRKSFAVRLIGRTMFCWFLKQKKSDNGQLIPDELLSSKIVSDNYYHNTLEPLFFGVLNTSIDSRDIRSDLFDKVPYLNGGLFNPQSDDYYELDRGTFASRHINTLKISDSWFKDFFELLETYNFTIDENTVFDQELSVDPEMLGRIFENLLAEINPETGSSERKRTGSFYTPRQIVEYMVDQSLIEYLKTKTKIDEKKLSALVSYDLTDDTEHPLDDEEKQEVVNAIESLKILDPACGSGAYPIGALQKIVYILQQIDPDCKMWLEQKLKNVPELYKKKIIDEVKSNPFDYTRKLDVIKNSIFGVDIQPIAVDVSRLRCFLTLVVESEVNDTKPNRGIEPLPNLDFKFVCANTLIGLPKSQSSNLFEDHSGIIELSTIMSEYFTANRSEKESIKTRFFNKQKDLLNRMIGLKATGELTLKLTLWNPFSNTSNSWFDQEWMFGLEEKFDFIIGNPPWGADLSKEQKVDLAELYPEIDSSTPNSFAYFIGLALRISKSNVSFILPDSILVKDYPKTRELFKNLLYEVSWFQNSGVPDEHKLFTYVSHDVCVLFMGKKDTLKVKCNKWEYDNGKYSKKHWEETNEILMPRDFEYRINLLATDDDYNLLKKVTANSYPLNSKYQCHEGVHTGNAREILFKKEKENEFCKPLFIGGKNGDVIQNYYSKPSGWYVDYRKEIVDEDKGYYASLRKEDIFKLPKIYITRTGNPIKSFYDENTYASNNFFSLQAKDYSSNTPENLKFILACLVSKFSNYFIRTFACPRLGNTFIETKITHLLNLPIPSVSEEKRMSIIELVDLVIKEKKKDIEADISKIESQIDELVIDLYGLNEEEKEIIRNS
ncbi:MAG: hypothetical protein RJA61_90 [Candidatus Parcubacteria bacterium]|jgi:hypothetical protein